MDTTNHPHIAVIGLGMWGEKLVRVATGFGLPLSGFDLRTDQAKRVKRQYPTIKLYTSIDTLLNEKSIAAVLIATPPSTHYQIAKAALCAGKHILIEKPMTQHVHEARELVRLATRAHRILMVDHTYLFSPAINKAKALLKNNAIGKIHRIESVRLGGAIVPNSTVLWDFASHDIAIAEYLLEKRPVNVCTKAKAFLPGNTLDEATIELTFAGNIRYQGRVSWNNPTKERSLTIIGELGAFLIRWEGKNETLTRQKLNRITNIKTSSKEPLREMLHYFLRSIATKGNSISSGETGLEVVKILSALHTSWRQRGVNIKL